MKRMLVLMAALTYCLGGQANEMTEMRHTHGNAGDPLRTHFSEARVMAEDRVRNLKLCEFKSGVDEAKAKWLVSVKEQLAEDIKLSKHVWLSDFQGSCAFTQFDVDQSPVYLSYPECRSLDKDHKGAMELLIHESLHHLGIEEEVDAEEYAAIIMEADILEDCPAQPYDHFDERTCQGSPITKADVLRYFTPGSNKSMKVGDTNSAARYRKCNTLTGCSDWVANTNALEWYFSGGTKHNIDEKEFEKPFSFSIKNHTVPSFNINLGVSGLHCYLSLANNKREFKCDPRRNFTSGRNSYTHQIRDTYTKQTILFTPYNSANNKQVMNFNQSCFWTKAITKGQKSENGDYYESEVVYFSNF